jgi:hypothetical protein
LDSSFGSSPIFGSKLGLAKDDTPKLKGQISVINHEAMLLEIADMSFWIDAKTKIEDSNSNHISFSDLDVGDTVELWYNDSQTNDDGFSYASKIETD